MERMRGIEPSSIQKMCIVLYRFVARKCWNYNVFGHFPFLRIILYCFVIQIFTPTFTPIPAAKEVMRSEPARPLARYFYAIKKGDRFRSPISTPQRRFSDETEIMYDWLIRIYRNETGVDMNNKKRKGYKENVKFAHL